MRVVFFLYYLAGTAAFQKIGSLHVQNKKIALKMVEKTDTILKAEQLKKTLDEDIKAYEEAEFVDMELVKRIEAEVLSLTGVGLDGLMNPSTVLNLERDLIDLNAKLCTEKDRAKIDEIQSKIQKKTDKLFTEKRLVMRGWLKNLFVGQSILAGVVSLGMVYNAIPGQDLPLPLQVLGFWMWWLFIIPSLRARKPGAQEKDALNTAFLLTPIVSLAAPFATKDTAALWWINGAAVAICYAYSYLKPKEELGADGEEGKSGAPLILLRILNALDYGSGRERGARK